MRERTARGLVPLRRYGDLADVAGRRATKMRDTNILSHSIAGDLGRQLTDEGVTWYRYGETIAYTYKAWANEAARDLVKVWMASAPHRDLLMSSRFNYIGVGLAYRSSNGRTFGSIVVSDVPDRSGASAWFTGARVIRRERRRLLLVGFRPPAPDSGRPACATSTCSTGSAMAAGRRSGTTR